MIWILCLIALHQSHGFSVTGSDHLIPRETALFAASSPPDENHPTTTRRRLLQATLATATVATIPTPSFASAEDITNLDCLLDLPPIPDNSIRLLLCRHGQTENNRLRIVQGRRMNPALNQNGQEQAQRLGMALSHLPSGVTKFYHSPLTRAQQTAMIASSELSGRSKLKVLDDLIEIDFGPVSDGQAMINDKSPMLKTYAAWAAGQFDVTPDGGGESARQVLERCKAVLNLLKRENKAGSTVVAVAHSAYIRILLGLVGSETSLTQVALLKQHNANVNVLDVNLSTTKDNLGISDIPDTNVVRINEIRHLAGLDDAYV